MAIDFGGLLQQYLGGAQNANANPSQVEDDFHQVTQNAPQATVGSGVAEAFRSDQTAPFSQMVGQLFGNGSSQQRAGMLNELLGSLSPAILGSLGGGLGGLLGARAGTAPAVTAEQADQIDPQQVEQIAKQAQQQDPSIMDRMGNFYAAHPTLVQTIGSAALAIAMRKIAERMKT